MSKNKYAVLTVDTEALPRRAETDHVRRLIWGEHAKGTAGVREMCAVGNEFGAKHVFFVDMCGAYDRREEMSAVVQWLDHDGQDVELHAHPEYLPEDFWPPFHFKARPRFMNQYGDDKDAFVIGHFGKMLSDLLDRPLRAFRAGSFRWNAGTLRALATHNIPLSFNNSMCAVHNRQCLYSVPTNDPFRWDNGIVEIPMSEKYILPLLHQNWWARLQYPQLKFIFSYRPRWSSFLPGSISHKTPFMVFLMHSWSLLYWDENGHGVYKDDARIEGYRKLIRQLTREYDVVTTAELLELIQDGKIVPTHTEEIAKAEISTNKKA